MGGVHADQLFTVILLLCMGGEEGGEGGLVDGGRTQLLGGGHAARVIHEGHAVVAVVGGDVLVALVHPRGSPGEHCAVRIHQRVDAVAVVLARRQGGLRRHQEDQTGAQADQNALHHLCSSFTNSPLRNSRVGRFVPRFMRSMISPSSSASSTATMPAITMPSSAPAPPSTKSCGTPFDQT